MFENKDIKTELIVSSISQDSTTFGDQETDINIGRVEFNSVKLNNFTLFPSESDLAATYPFLLIDIPEIRHFISPRIITTNNKFNTTNSLFVLHFEKGICTDKGSFIKIDLPKTISLTKLTINLRTPEGNLLATNHITSEEVSEVNGERVEYHISLLLVHNE